MAKGTRAAVAVLATVIVVLGAGGAWATDPGSRIETGLQAYRKGDLARAALEIEAALIEHDRLGKDLAAQMPAAPAGWSAETSEIQGLGAVGGGLSVTRAYTKGDASMNATVLLDNPVAGAAALAAGRKIKVGTEDGVLRWDPVSRSGEVGLAVGDRAVVQIEADGLTSQDVLVDFAKSFNIAALRRAAGL